jgi:hypothetical protein
MTNANNFNIDFVSSLIQQQFPDLYQVDGPNLIIFMQAYYEWMEDENKPLWYQRNLLNFRDIDNTVDDFIVHFKEKYLNGIQFETVSNKRLFIKHALEFWRAKGTIRAVNLLFQLVYGDSAIVYYPKEDILRTSDGEWILPIYIEVNDAAQNFNFIGKQIQGTRSGATAFVEEYRRKKLGTKEINIFYISNLVGNFQTGELLRLSSDNSIDGVPHMIGSMTELIILAGGTNFNIGDIVNIYNSDGVLDGLARVSSINNLTGTLSITLLDGGFGYELDTPIILSNNVFFVSNIVTNTIGLKNDFDILETFVQPLANIVYSNLLGSNISTGDSLTTYYANTDIAGTAVVLSVTANIAASNGQLFVALNSGNIDLGIAQLYDRNTGATANLTSFVDQTATANIMGLSSNATLYLSNSLYTWTKGMFVFEGIVDWDHLPFIDALDNIDYLKAYINVAIGTVQGIVTNGANITLFCTNVSGAFTSFDFGSGIYANGQPAIQGGWIYDVATTIGVIQEVGTFTVIPGNFIKGVTSNTTGQLDRISTGSGAAFKISYLTNKESDLIFTDFLNGNNIAGVPYMDLRLDGSNSNVAANGYGFPKLPSGNVNTIMLKCFGEIQANLGTIGDISLVNPGSGYNWLPFVLIYDPKVAGADLLDYIINIGPPQNFLVGELVEEITDVPNSVILTVAGIVSPVDGFFINTGGSLYTNGDLVIATGGTNANASITTNSTGGIILLTPINYGSGFVPNTSPAISFSNSTGGASSGSAANVTVSIPTFSLGEAIFEANSTANIASGIVASTSLSGNTGTVSVQNITGIFNTSFPLSGVTSHANATITDVGGTYQIVAKGLVKIGSSSSTLFVRRLSYTDSFTAPGIILGVASGATSNILSISPDPNSNTIGWDATVNLHFNSANGEVGSLDVLDSGFGYANGDIVTFSTVDGTNPSVGEAEVILINQGKAQGYYKGNRGFLSDTKYLQDGEYYQEFSYEIRTGVPLNHYADMFKKVMHVAGTRLFGAVYLNSNNSLTITDESNVSISS